MPESSPDSTQVDGMGTPAVPAPPGGTTMPGLIPAATTGQGAPATSEEPSIPQTPSGTPSREPAPAPEQTFYDPRELPPEMQPIWKQMQAAFTKRTQALAQERQKVEAYNSFMADPVGNIMRLAPQYGLTLTPAQAAAIHQQAQQQAPQQQGPWEPQTWQDVDERIRSIEERARQSVKAELMQEMAPVFQTVRGIVQQSAEQQLNQIDPMWREYEPRMMELLKDYPKMSERLEDLYYLAAREKIEARAIQNYEHRQRQKVEGARVSPGSSTRGTAAPRTIKSFDDAVAAAREELAKQSRR